MSDPIIDELARANPVPKDCLGELDHDQARQLLDRITAPARPRSRIARRVAIAVLVAIGITAPLALAAQRTQLLDFAFGDPAPKHVRQQLDQMLPPAYGPKEGPPDSWNRMNIVKGSERLVAQTLLANGKVAHMYAVNLKNGGVCWVTYGKPFGGGGCGKETAALRERSPLLASWGSCCGTRGHGRFATGAWYAGRALPIGAATLIVAYRDGMTDDVPLDHGWFMYAVPVAHELIAHEPVRFEIRDSTGREVGRVRDPFGLFRAPSRPAEKPVHPRLLERVSLGFGGGELELSEAKGNQGHRSVRVLNTIDPIQTSSWVCGAFVGSGTPPEDGTYARVPKRPVQFERGEHTGGDRAAGYTYFRGWVGAPVASLELRFQDSTVQRLDLHDGFFVYVVPADHWSLGSRPSYVIGRNAAGRIIYRRFLYPQARCAYPGRDARCKSLFFANG